MVYSMSKRWQLKHAKQNRVSIRPWSKFCFNRSKQKKSHRINQRFQELSQGCQPVQKSEFHKQKPHQCHARARDQKLLPAKKQGSGLPPKAASQVCSHLSLIMRFTPLFCKEPQQTPLICSPFYSLSMGAGWSYILLLWLIQLFK